MTKNNDLLDWTEEVGEISRKQLTVFFIIDTSSSMLGEKINAVNTAMEEALINLQDVENSDCEIRIAVLTFSSGCEWLTPRPVNLNTNWVPLQASGLTDFKAACEELNNKLSKSHGFMNSASQSYAPVLFLMTDGYPTDDNTSNGELGVSALRNNAWYKAAIRVAIAIGDGANRELCENFTGHPETVVTVHNADTLKALIKTIAVTSSQVASSSSVVNQKENVTDGPESVNGTHEVGKAIVKTVESVENNKDFIW